MRRGGNQRGADGVVWVLVWKPCVLRVLGFNFDEQSGVEAEPRFWEGAAPSPLDMLGLHQDTINWRRTIVGEDKRPLKHCGAGPMGASPGAWTRTRMPPHPYPCRAPSGPTRPTKGPTCRTIPRTPLQAQHLPPSRRVRLPVGLLRAHTAVVGGDVQRGGAAGEPRLDACSFAVCEPRCGVRWPCRHPGRPCSKGAAAADVCRGQDVCSVSTSHARVAHAVLPQSWLAKHSGAGLGN